MLLPFECKSELSDIAYTRVTQKGGCSFSACGWSKWSSSKRKRQCGLL